MTGSRSIPGPTAMAKRNLLAIAVGGSVGSLARFAIMQELNHPSSLAWGTLAVNLLGSLLLGIATGSPRRTEHWQLGLCVGFLGSFTTLSAVAVELTSWPGQAATTLGYLGLTVLGGLLAARLGRSWGTRLRASGE